jgi:hypothetical protein
MFNQVWVYNMIIFVLDSQTSNKKKNCDITSITFEFKFPAVPVHPV